MDEAKEKLLVSMGREGVARWLEALSSPVSELLHEKYLEATRSKGEGREKIVLCCLTTKGEKMYERYTAEHTFRAWVNGQFEEVTGTRFYVPEFNDWEFFIYCDRKGLYRLCERQTGICIAMVENNVTHEAAGVHMTQAYDRGRAILQKLGPEHFGETIASLVAQMKAKGVL